MTVVMIYADDDVTLMTVQIVNKRRTEMERR